ncbi:MAG: beta-N-acetylhexosaminidase, partial [Mucilaginibacter sp.]
MSSLQISAQKNSSGILSITAAIAVLLTSFTVNAQFHIIPQPLKIAAAKGKFSLKNNSVIGVDEGSKTTAAYLQTYLAQKYNLHLKIKIKPAVAAIRLRTAAAGVKGAYHLDVTASNIKISGDSDGIFNGIQSLIQLLPATATTPLRIAACHITDEPRFQWRGLSMDVSRHFFTVDEVKKYIDMMAHYKLNIFHWHLTDDEGWRIQIDKYPKLTDIGSKISYYEKQGKFRKLDNLIDGGRDGFYTKDDILEVLKYAKERFVTVLPEIEMPGHSEAAIFAYPELGCQDSTGAKHRVRMLDPGEGTFTFMENVLTEVIALFPNQYIHIGGDEAEVIDWLKSPTAVALMKKEGMTKPEQVQSYFIKRIEKFLLAHNKKLVGWDEILQGGLAESATVMSWQGEQGGITAAKQNHDVIMTPDAYCYFDHSQSKNEDSVTIGSYLPLDKVYRYEPIPAALNAGEATHVLGAQANVWTEYIGNTKKLEYILFPRMAALAEVLWSPKEKRSWPDFESRLPGIFERYDASGINYSHAYLDLQAYVVPVGNSIKWKIESKNKKGKIIYTTPGKPHTTAVYSEPILINQSGEYSAALTDGKNRPVSRWVKQQFYLNKASGRKVTLTYPPSDNYPGSGGFTLVDGVL